MPTRFSREYRGYYLIDASLHLRIVSNSPRHGDLAGATGRDALVDELGGVDENSGARALFKAVFTQVADLGAERCKQSCTLIIATRFVRDNLRFMLFIREIELQSHETLSSAVLKVFDRVLVTGVVRNYQQEAIGRIENRAQLVDGQSPAVVSKRVDDDGSVLACLYDFVQVADAARLHGARQWGRPANASHLYRAGIDR